MSKSVKIFSIILILFSLFINFYGVYATTDINMNLETNNSANSDSVNTNTDTYTPPSNIGVIEVLNILLITVGLVLILLGIAIITRLK